MRKLTKVKKMITEGSYLLRGVFDIPAHGAPDLIPRKFADMELAIQASLRA